jgi:hypothetical protein
VDTDDGEEIPTIVHHRVFRQCRGVLFGGGGRRWKRVVLWKGRRCVAFLRDLGHKQCIDGLERRPQFVVYHRTQASHGVVRPSQTKWVRWARWARRWAERDVSATGRQQWCRCYHVQIGFSSAFPPSTDGVHPQPPLCCVDHGGRSLHVGLWWFWSFGPRGGIEGPVP